MRAMSRPITKNVIGGARPANPNKPAPGKSEEEKKSYG